MTRDLGSRYVSIVHGGQAAVDAAVMKLFPEWTDNVHAPVQTAVEHAAALDHVALPSAAADAATALSVHDDLDEYLLEMDKDSVAGSSFSVVEGSVADSGFAAKHGAPSSGTPASRDSASFLSATDAIEAASAAKPDDAKSNLDQLSVMATRMRLLKRSPQGAALIEAGDIPCSDLDAGEVLKHCECDYA
jgi:hypothetical protein